MQEGTSISFSHPPVTATAVDKGNVFAAQCPTRQLLDRIADKWTFLLLATLANGPMRFNALRRHIEGVSQKMLSQTLRQMERDGLITRTVEPTVPVTVIYQITPLGQTLVSAMQGVIDWAETHMAQVAAAQIAYDQRND